ncbi:MAG: class II aldolase/adducin family protein [Pseudomonadota bacterium]
MKKAERALRQAIIDKCRYMNASGLNQGTSGNISARYQDRMLITPSATPYDAMEPEMIAAMPFEGAYGVWEGPLRPSTEWRFHFDILKSRPDAGAVVHAHPTYCTALAMARKEIPPAHYMMAAFGGTTVRCAPYARFGTAALSTYALEALQDRTACLLANHGSIAIGADIDKAMWLAVELETIARQFYLTLLIGGPVLLSDAQIAETAEAFGSYGVQDDHKSVATAKTAKTAKAGKTSKAAKIAKAGETVKAVTPKAETPKVETAKAETPKAETAKAETAKAETAKADAAETAVAKPVSSGTVAKTPRKLAQSAVKKPARKTAAKSRATKA